MLGTDVVVTELKGFSRSDSSSTFFARGVNGMWPLGDEPPCPMMSSTWLRTASREMDSDSSALAATPSPSWMRPRRMCSVPM